MSRDFSRFTDRIREVRREILDKCSDDPVNTNEFHKLLTKLSIFRSKPFPGALFILILDESELKKLDQPSIRTQLEDKIQTELQTYNWLYVTGKFEVLEREVYRPANESEALDVYRDFSETGKCVFVITKAGITYFYQGKPNLPQSSGVFLTETAIKKYSEKKDISEVLQILDDYKKQIEYRHVYEKFFVPKTTLQRLWGKEKNEYYPNRNLLRNRPELVFRDDLKAFLSERIAGTFNISKEPELETMSRLDINITDENGDYFFFEIKWMGVSNGPKDDGPNTSYNSDHMKAGINQTVRYVKELTEEKKTVKVGYLIIFDAREPKTEYSLKPFDYLDDGLEEYLCFITPKPDFYLDNTHPR